MGIQFPQSHLPIVIGRCPGSLGRLESPLRYLLPLRSRCPGRGRSQLRLPIPLECSICEKPRGHCLFAGSFHGFFQRQTVVLHCPLGPNVLISVEKNTDCPLFSPEDVTAAAADQNTGGFAAQLPDPPEGDVSQIFFYIAGCNGVQQVVHWLFFVKDWTSS